MYVSCLYLHLYEIHYQMQICSHCLFPCDKQLIVCPAVPNTNFWKNIHQLSEDLQSIFIFLKVSTSDPNFLLTEHNIWGMHHVLAFNI